MKKLMKTVTHVCCMVAALTLYAGPGLANADEWLELFDAMGSGYRVHTGSAWLLAIAIGAAAVGVRRRLESGAPRDKHET